MSDVLTLNVVDFSATPFGRYREDGPESGQVYREDVLVPALADHGKVIVNVDGVAGLPSSFWEEALGGLVREGISLEDIEAKLELVTTESPLEVFIRLGWRYIHEEAAKSDTRRGRG